MTEALVQRVEITGQDLASAAIRDVVETLAKLDRQARKTSETLAKAFGSGLQQQFAKLQTQTEEFGADLVSAAEKAAKALRADVTAAGELREALKSVTAEQRRIGEAARASQTAFASAHANEARSVRNAASARGRASNAAMRDIRSTWSLRDRSERAEVEHVRTLRRERAGLRREVAAAARETWRSGKHAIKGVNHPHYESAGLYAAGGAAAAAGFAKHALTASEDLDTAVTRLKMFAPSLDANAARRKALDDSIALGTSSSLLVDMIAKSVRDGVPVAIAQTLPKSITAASQVMSGDPEKLTDSLAEGLQEAVSMKWIKTATDARRFLNVEAGLSNFGGNSPEKMEQFIAAGGLGHGKELGLDMVNSMAYGALLNSNGMRTGQASARFEGQLSQSVPKMYDRWMGALQSPGNSEEDRAVKSAPFNLGYGSIQQMQKSILAGPEGLIDFAERLQKLSDKSRKLTLEGFGFSEQGGAALAEIGAGPEKARAVVARAKQLAEEKEANDYLSNKFKEWQTSLSNMLKQIEQGWRAIESEIGDQLKQDIVSPFRDWWAEVSKEIVHSNLKQELHNSVVGFVHGLGFDDVKSVLDGMSSNFKGFDFAGFATGIGEGLRAIGESFRYIGSILGNSGLSSETIGRLGTELLGLSVAAWFLGPVIGIIGSISSAFLALRAAIGLGGALLRLTGIADGLRAIAGIETATTGASLLSVAGGLVALGAAIEGLMAAGVLQHFAIPKNTSSDEISKFLWGVGPDGKSLAPSVSIFGMHPFASGPDTPKGTSDSDAYWRRKKAALHLQSFDGSGDYSNLLHRASWSPSDAGQVAQDAVIDSGRTLVQVRDQLVTTNDLLRNSVLGLSNSDIGGNGAGGGNANLRYGRGAAGGYRSTPGTGSFGNPSKSLLDYIAQSEGTRGYNTSLGFGKYLPGGKEQDLTSKSLNEILALGDSMRKMPGNPNSSALGRYQMTGGTIRDLMKRMGLNGSEKFDAKMQDAMASKLISDEGPRALGRWALLTGGKMTTAQGLLRSGQIASQPDASMSFSGGSGNTGGAVDKAMSMLGMGEGASGKALGAYMHSGEWCADFVNATLKSAGVKGSGSAMAASFSQWGKHVDMSNAQKGDVIEERHGNHVGHVGLATGNVQRDRNGNVTAVEMVSGNYGNAVRKNWEKVGMIADLRRSDEAVAAVARKVTEQSHPAAIAKKVQSVTSPQGGSDDSDFRKAGGQSADASAGSGHTFNMTFNHHVADPHQLASIVGKELENSLGSRSHDLDHYVG